MSEQTMTGEPVARVIVVTQDVRGTWGQKAERATVQWLTDAPPVGTPLYAHPRPRVEVTETMDDALRAAMGRIRADMECALNEAYQSATPVCCGRPGDECCGSPDPSWDDASKAIMDTLGPIHQQLTAALALVDEPKPRVGVTEAMVEAARTSYAASKRTRLNITDGHLWPDSWPEWMRDGMRSDMRAALTAALALADEAAPGVVECAWVRSDEYDDDRTYESGCGNTWEFNDDGPVENGMKFCCYCGKPVKASATRALADSPAPLANGGGEVGP